MRAATIHRCETAKKRLRGGARNGGPVAAPRNESQPQVVDQRVDETGAVIAVADRPRTDIHEGHRREEHADLDQCLWYEQGHTEELAVAEPLRVHCASNSGLSRIRPSTK